LVETPAAAGKDSARAAPSVRVRTECRYARALQRQSENQEGSVQTVTTSALVTGLTGKQLEVVRFRQLDRAGFPGEAAALWVTWAERDNEALPRGWLASTEMRLVDGLNRPAAFGAALKPGDTAITRSPLFGYRPPFPQTLPLRLLVMVDETVERRACVGVERTAATRLPLALMFFRLLNLREQLWTEPHSGAVVKYEGTARLQHRDEPAALFLTATFRLKEVREIPPADLKRRREDAGQLMAAADLLAGRSGEPGESRVKEAPAPLERFREDAPRVQELAKRQTALVGKPALKLKDLAGRERTLGEYRGKIILLCAFASW
jgi:hypothetical protein